MTAVAGGNSLVLSGVTLAGNAVCTLDIVVQGVATGYWTNTATVTAVSSGAGNASTVAVTVFAIVPALGLSAKLLLMLLTLAAGLAALKGWPVGRD